MESSPGLAMSFMEGTCRETVRHRVSASVSHLVAIQAATTLGTPLLHEPQRASPGSGYTTRLRSEVQVVDRERGMSSTDESSLLAHVVQVVFKSSNSQWGRDPVSYLGLFRNVCWGKSTTSPLLFSTSFCHHIHLQDRFTGRPFLVPATAPLALALGERPLHACRG